MPSLIGNKPNQVPTVGDLGTLAFQDSNAVNITGGAITTTSAFSANGGATLGDASGDALTINSSAVSVPNGLNFDSNTFVIDATNNRVGVGTASPTTALTVNGTTTSNIFVGTGIISTLASNTSGIDSYGLTMNRTGANYVGLLNGGVGTSLVFTSDATVFKNTANTTERMRIDSSGNVLIGKTSATANGGDLQVSSGITFPATQSASSDANTLDDYEEGTWTPVTNSFTEVLGGGSITKTGTYTKIGRFVQVNLTITCAGGATIAATAGAGSFITGLPFNPAVGSTGTWANGSSFTATGGIYAAGTALYVLTGWSAVSNNFIFSAVYTV